MKYLPILLLIASCQRWSWSGAADVITPDELTLGQGRSSSTMSGGVDTWWEGDDWPIETESENEASYVALTWDIPTWQGHEDGMSRETQRNLALLIDQMVDQEVTEIESESVLGMALVEGAKPPPSWLPMALGGIVIAGMLAFFLTSRRQDKW